MLLAAASPALAARPSSVKLLPRETLAFVRVTDAQQLRERFLETALGRMSQDPQVRPLFEQLYGSASEALAGIEKQLDLSLDQLLQIPQGEVSLALLPGDNGRPAVALIVEVGDHLPAAQKLVERVAEMAGAGGDKSEEVVGDVKLTIYPLGGRNRQAVYFEKDGAVVITTSIALSKQVLEFWDGKSDDSLASNPKYLSIMKSCQAAGEEPVQIRWFVDPIALARGVTQGNAGAQIALAILPALGLDGFEGVGGSMTLATGEFDSIMHLHVLLSNPRSGVLDVLKLESGDTTPERWVRADAASYMTLNWDIETSYRNISKLVDSFQGEGFLAGMIKRTLTERTGLDLETDILPALEGRVSVQTSIEKPATLNSQASLGGVKLRDAAAFTTTLDKLIARMEGSLVKRSYGGVTYYCMGSGEVEDPTKQRLCFGIVDDYALAADRPTVFENAITTSQVPAGSLANSLDFKLIASKVKRQTGETKPGMITFNRPEEGLRFWYDLAQSDKTRDQLKTGNNPLFKALSSALEKHPLPPFEILARYFAAGGGMVVNGDTGFHMTSFTLKRN